MTWVLVNRNTDEIVTVWSRRPKPLALPTGDLVEGHTDGWSNDDYVLREVVRFNTPAGYRRVGSPTYTVEPTRVVEVYATEDIPAETEWRVKIETVIARIRAGGAGPALRTFWINNPDIMAEIAGRGVVLNTQTGVRNFITKQLGLDPDVILAKEE